MRVSTHTVTDRDDTATVAEAGKLIEVMAVSDGALSAAPPNTPAGNDNEAGKKRKAGRIQGWRVLAYGMLPALALVLTLAAGVLKWQDASTRATEVARIESVAAAKDSTVALLSYDASTVKEDLESALDRLTGNFKDSYTQLIHDVVIPGAQERQISATATVPAAASVTADPTRAVVLLFVNQTVAIGTDAPTDSASRVRVTLDKVGDRWLISEFEPV